MTAKENQGFKIYPIKVANKAFGLITAFFDDFDEPLIITTPLFHDDVLLFDIFDLLSQNCFEIYFFDEQNRELLGVRARSVHALSIKTAMKGISFPSLEDDLPKILKEMADWFGQRTKEDDQEAFEIQFIQSLYPDSFQLISKLELNAPGASQERDISAFLCRAFPNDAVFLNPFREDKGTELTDVLVVTEKFILIVQAKTSPITLATLRRNIARKHLIIRSHIQKGANQLRGAIDFVLSREVISLKVENDFVKFICYWSKSDRINCCSRDI